MTRKPFPYFLNIFKVITGPKFEIFLLGFSLSSGTTRAVFAKFGKMLCSTLELIESVKSGVQSSENVLQIVIRAYLSEFPFDKVSSFEHILLNNFTRMRDILFQTFELH